MAEKKFFVDINLQGSALTNAKIGTNSAIGSTEGAFGYDSSAHRLQYFDGTATKEVANLSDIAAVTGGLIFQGGYDPATNTPDILDEAIYKGYFWVITAPGTFLGESLQVGDSIVAKIDGAGGSITDWLILQGNIVIATDSVDGISRLATQTEANDGTEAGAVVITPATLQGKIDAQITPEISNKLPLAGGTMTGGINMAGNELNIGVGGSLIVATGATEIYFGDQRVNGIGTPASDDDAANKGYVDDQDALKLSLTGGTMSGAIDMGNNSVNNVDGVNANGINTNTLSSPGNDITFLVPLTSTNGATITNLPAPTDGGDAANKTYVDDNTSNKLPLDGSQSMTGNLNMGGNVITNATSVDANNIYTGSVTTNELTSSNSNGILVSKDLSLDGNSIKNLAEPINNNDAARKGYVDAKAATAQANAEATASADATAKADAAQAAAEAYADSLAPNYDAAGSASTAESNANAYTDTEIAAQSFTAVIATGDWTLDGDLYTVAINHNFGTTYLQVSALYEGQFAEFAYDSTNANILFIGSSFVPTQNVAVNINKSGGNL
jgi:hypothetical protein